MVLGQIANLVSDNSEKGVAIAAVMFGPPEVQLTAWALVLVAVAVNIWRKLAVARLEVTKADLERYDLKRTRSRRVRRRAPKRPSHRRKIR